MSHGSTSGIMLYICNDCLFLEHNGAIAASAVGVVTVAVVAVLLLVGGIALAAVIRNMRKKVNSDSVFELFSHCNFTVIGTNLSEPHTSVTALCMCVYISMLAWTDHLL